MAVYQVIYWQEIPSQVEARDAGGRPHKEPLSKRFLELIDIVAIKRKMTASDDYMAGWRRGPKVERDGGAFEVARAVAAELEAKFDDIRTQAIPKI